VSHEVLPIDTRPRAVGASQMAEIVQRNHYVESVKGPNSERRVRIRRRFIDKRAFAELGI
jgi:hypothetical protein